MYWKPPKPEIANLLDRAMKCPAIKVNTSVANQFSKYSPIRQLRKKNKIYIAMDRRKDVSIIYFDGINIHKKGKNYLFDIF